jgi:two-component system cell cycle response regulator
MAMQHILVIDDAPEIHALLDVRLRAEEVSLVHALSPSEGMTMAQTLKPDLILLDMEMPETSGLDLCRALKADPVLHSIPVIFLTGTSEVLTKVRGFNVGAVDYVTKPFEPAELRARVAAALRTKRLLDLLSSRAQLDGLSGLYNRAHFDQRLRDELDAARAEGRPTSLILADIDHFKQINDTHGHPFGDRVIEAVARILRKIPEAHAACRYGGEEFGLILHDTTPEDALVLAEELLAHVAAISLPHGGRVVNVSASFGVASTVPTEGDEMTPAELLAAADGALYAAKHAGRGCARLAGAPLAPCPP